MMQHRAEGQESQLRNEVLRDAGLGPGSVQSLLRVLDTRVGGASAAQRSEIQVSGRIGALVGPLHGAIGNVTAQGVTPRRLRAS